jgi:hypothetical protein
MPAEWTVDENGTGVYYADEDGELAAAEVMPVPDSPDSLRTQAERALVADVAAARLVPDLCAVIDRHINGWHRNMSHKTWTLPRRRHYRQAVIEPMTPGEVAALAYARKHGGGETARQIVDQPRPHDADGP